MINFVPVYDLKPGMTLAQDVYARNGRFLIGRNTRLEPEHLQVLKVWGVTEAGIATDLDPAIMDDLDQELDPERRALVEPYVLERFQNVDLEHPAMRELFRLILKRKISQNNGTGNIQAQSPAKSHHLQTEQGYAPHLSLSPSLEAVMEHIDKLPSLPNLFFELQEAVDSHTCDAKQLANIISRDPSLAARLLGLVNSAFYGFPSRIDSITRAVIIVGTKRLTMLAMATTILDHFRYIPNGLINMRLFWEHSIATGIASRTIASMINAPNTERFFVAGLLHDLGRLILFDQYPMAGRRGLVTAAEDQKLLWVAERDVLDFDHACIGGKILEKWQMPPILVDSVGLHHQPAQANQELCPEAVHLADILINAIELGKSGERYVPALDSGSWERLGLGVGCFSMLIVQLERIFSEVLQAIFPEQE